ncbi:MAG: tRNA (adenosine(37)-N6)-dimethylallyltransferase MiaA [Pseudomonadota bacterium]
MNTNKKQRLVIIVGPTASGKTGLSLALAENLHGEIINADSMQVYRLMDIGTAKPSPAERKMVPHHVIDVVYPDEAYNAARYRADATAAVNDISGREKGVFIVGGTGLYIKALLRGIFPGPAGGGELRALLWAEIEEKGVQHSYEELKDVDPRAAERIHPHDSVRIIRALEVFRLTGVPISEYQSDHGFRESPYRYRKIGLAPDRDELYRRIDSRAREMLGRGLIEEVERLLAEGYSEDLKPMQSLGYRHVMRYLRGDYGFDEMLTIMTRDTRHYAKRQLTWFRNDPEVNWYHPDDIEGISKEVKGFIEEDHAV